jgi:uridylate kinase
MSRILLKLSGEALSGPHKDSLFDESVLSYLVTSIKKIKEAGNEIMLVIGGGNIFRGSTLSNHVDIKRSTADYIGMLATIQNALVIRDYFISHDVETCVISAIEMSQICEAYTPSTTLMHLKKGDIVIFGGGIGTPYFTTDTTAAERALEMLADSVIYVKNGVDGLYTADPNKEEGATFIKEITAREVLEKDLRGLDQTAITLARDNNLIVRVIGMTDLPRVMSSEVGTLITPK